MTHIGVPYFLTRHEPGVDYVIPFGTEVRAELADEPGWPPLVPLYEAVAEAVAADVADGGWPAVISGDCTVALGTVAGLQRAGLDPGIVWLDAHGDVQTMETTHSGFLGGMPLRILVGYRPELIAAELGLRPVPEERVVLVDARDLDPPEKEYLSQAKMRHVALDDLETLPDGPLYVHLDLDIVDPSELPDVRYPAPGGSSLAAVVESMHKLFETGRVVGAGIACTWSAGTVIGDQTRDLINDILPALT